MLFHVIVVIALLDLLTTFLLHNLVATVVQHSLLGYPLYAVTILVGLMLLRDRLTVLVLAGAVFKVGFLLHLAVLSHLGGAYKGLADVGTSLSSSMQALMCLRKLHHFFKGVLHGSKQRSTKEIVSSKGSKLPHNLMHLFKGIPPEVINLIIAT